MPLKQLLTQLTAQFEAAGIESAQADAELLVADVLNCGRGELAVKIITGEPISEQQQTTIEELAAKRAERVPLQHLTGKAYFRNLELSVGPGVFVPRPETEQVAQLAIDALKSVALAEPIAIDLATGSGAIALSLATEVSYAKVYAVELSDDAIGYTRKNFERWAPDAELRQGDLSVAFDDLAGQVDVLISNPPYIPEDMVPIYPEVHLHDPKLALYSGKDGLDLIRVISKRGLMLVKPGGTLVIEHADPQSQAVREILEADGWRQVRAHRDFNLRDRAVSAIR
ncbi:MAG: peptide chain release factor N(5)-glutamine methyltransferase [Actinomycetota bacterium]|jgi:release factor glutamine methyltransferase